MHARQQTAHANLDAVAVDDNPANDRDAPRATPTLDALGEQLGAPSDFVRDAVFVGFDPAAGLDLGQQVASERILAAVPTFVSCVLDAWAAMIEGRRQLVLGFNPAMLSVLVAETLSLRTLNGRYDRVARVSAITRARCEAAARDAQRDARERHGQCARMLKKHMPLATQKDLSLDAATQDTEGPAALAVSLDALGDAVAAWRAGMSPEALCWYAALGFGDAFAPDLHNAATRLRETQADLHALTDPTRVTQRQLDEQDGRVLHLVGTIHLAFKLAARRDPHVIEPDLGELDAVFVRGKADEVPVHPAPPSPPTPPA